MSLKNNDLKFILRNKFYTFSKKNIYLFFFLISFNIIADDALRVILFYSPECNGCYEVKNVAFSQIENNFKDKISVELYNIDKTKNFLLLLNYEDFYKVKSKETLKVFVGSKVLSGKKDILSNLHNTISLELKNKSKTYLHTANIATKNESSKIDEKFNTFGLSVVALSGLIDGINPCAFVTLVFFISVLSNLRKSQKDILLVGISFSLSVFLTYLLLGFGCLKILKVFSVQSGIAEGINYVVAFFCLILAIYSFIDFFKYKRSGKAKDISLKIPDKFRRKINRLINTKMRTSHIVYGAFVLGVAISLLESVCTGQVYLPTITFILQDNALNIKAIWYLILYNLMFIIPLLLVFALVYFGVSSEQITNFFKRHLLLSKLLMALLFLSLSLILFLT